PYRAVTFDIRGHGASDVGDGQYSIEFFVDDLVALLDHLHIQQTILCGLSMGGYIALRMYERFPARINGLILSNTKSAADSDETKIKRAATIRAMKQNGVHAFAENFLQSVFWKETFHSNPAAVASIRELIVTNSPLGICGTQLALAARTDTTHVLPTIHIPTMVITGEYDVLAPPAEAQAMSKNISGSELHIVPRAAHLSNIENSDEFNRLMKIFLAMHWKNS
ncbi:MAG TPA: alpha/beta fold hydrolase, partial [Bacteroidota bacterium]|nr:alpha/beta fold hydrolase [Bacteroidota bacterium]